MEVIENKDNSLKNVTKIVKKLKIRGKPLKNYSVKLATEYMKTDDEINNLEVEVQTCKKVENECIEGLYKQHVTLHAEPKMSRFYNKFSYENLINKYEEKIDDYRNNNEELVITNSKKQLIHMEKTKIMDMLARQFANGDFDKVNLMEIAGLTKRETEKLYKNTKRIIEDELENIVPKERENIRDTNLGNLQYTIANYWYEKENGKSQTKVKISIWERIKQFFRIKRHQKLLEEGLEEKQKKKIEELRNILKTEFYETEFAGNLKEEKGYI